MHSVDLLKPNAISFQSKFQLLYGFFKTNPETYWRGPRLMRFDHHMIRDRAELSARHLLLAVILSKYVNPVASLIYRKDVQKNFQS